MIDAFREDLGVWMGNRKLLSLALIAAVATLAFLTFRYVASVVMVMIASPWLALAVGLALASAVASPVLVKGVVGSMTQASGRAPNDVSAPPPPPMPPRPADVDPNN